MHAFLVLAHTDPAMTVRLARTLAGVGTVLVHVDAGSDIAPFEPAADHATLLASRIRVRWGGWSIVEATALLASRALEDPAVQRLTLLSGVHYPVIDPERLRDPGDREHIRLLPCPDASVGKPAERFEQRFVSRFAPRTRAAAVANGVARRLPPLDPEAALAGRQLYGGSSWWSLTRETYVSAAGLLDRDRALRAWARRTLAPDESVWHTAVGAVLAARDGQDGPRRAERETTFVSWAGGRHPEALTAASIDRARAEGWWFARKFATQQPELLRHAERGWR